MAKLSDLLSTREIAGNQENLEKGKVWVVTVPSMFACVRSDFMYCWRSPGCGTLTMEVWGAAGSGSRMCCCGFGLPGNAPGYSKKTIAVWPDTYICGCPGQACNAHDLCNSGCSVASYLRWGNARDLCGFTGGCMCAQGGRSGTAICTTGSSAYCCYTAAGFCTTKFTGVDNCGIVCNHCSGAWLACGYGGDINKCGCIGYAQFKGCYAICICSTESFIPYASGIFSQDGGHFGYTHDDDPQYSEWSGMGHHNAAYALNSLSRSPSGGMPWSVCYNGQQACGCYETLGCYVFMPYGVAGGPPFPCPGVRDHGKRGGMGAIRLTYRGSGVMEQNQGKLGGAY